MDWDFVNDYAYLTIGQVRTTPLTDGERMGGDGRSANHALDDAAKGVKEVSHD